MTYGQIVAKRYRRQYYDGRKKKWDTFPSWGEQQPEQVYTILRELKSKAAIEALLNVSWTRRLPKLTQQPFQRSKADD